MNKQQATFTTIAILLILLPATPLLFTQPQTQIQIPTTTAQDSNTVGNAAGTTALIVSGAALMATLGLSQEAIGVADNAEQLLRQPLNIQTVHALKNTTTTAKALRVVLSNTLPQPVDVSQLSVTITSDQRDHKAIYADICTESTPELACILPPRQDKTTLLQQGERIELYLQTPLKRNTPVEIEIRTPQTKTVINTDTPNVFRTRHTRIR